MADPHAISILRRKRDEIESAIAAYEAKLEEARRDLSAVNATLLGLVAGSLCKACLNVEAASIMPFERIAHARAGSSD